MWERKSFMSWYLVAPCSSRGGCCQWFDRSWIDSWEQNSSQNVLRDWASRTGMCPWVKCNQIEEYPSGQARQADWQTKVVSVFLQTERPSWSMIVDVGQIHPRMPQATPWLESLKDICKPVIAGKDSSIADAILLQRDLRQFQGDSMYMVLELKSGNNVISTMHQQWCWVYNLNHYWCGWPDVQHHPHLCYGGAPNL